jgi:acyl-CoA synthetase (NDP forming)/GNAT superfamily N-acetyltransferase
MGATVPAQESSSYALLTDGSYVRIRRAAPEDWQAVHDFAAALGPESVYRRFFGLPNDPGRIVANAVCAPGGPATPSERGALLALRADEVVGLAQWIGTGKPGEAEIAFTVADSMHGKGVATLLAEHLLDAAHRSGVRRFTAVTQADNHAMLDVFTTLGVPAKYTYDDGTWMLSLDLELDAADRETLLEAEAWREQIADDASLRRFLDPRSVAVVGEPQASATRAVRDNLRSFAGRVEAAGPDGGDLPPGARIDLAVITSPPDLAVSAARACAEHGAAALVVTSTGFDAEQGRALLTVCRKAGMRLIGPGSLGVAHPRGGRGLNATLAQVPIAPGGAAVAVQSGGVGLALLSHLARLGIGIGSFAGVGEKYDVSANDLLMHWQDDPDTRLGLLHVESFGNPRKFARTARRLSRRIPLLAVDPEQSPSQARTALYAQAGITTVPSLGALVAAAALVAHQHEPRGPRVAVLGNTHGMLSLATAACAAAGLTVVAAVNVAPDADAGRLYRTMKLAAEDDGCDALLVALAPTAPHAPVDGLGHDAVPADVPLLAVVVDQAETVTLQPDASGRKIPCYDDAVVAAGALAAAVAAAHRRAAPVEPPAEPAGIDRQTAARVIGECFATAPRGRGLYQSERSALLSAYGIRSAPAPSPDGRAATRVVVTAWQDFIFGPLLTCARGGESESAAVALAPATVSDLRDMALRALGRSAAGLERLMDLLARTAALVDDRPEITAVRVTVWADDDGAVRIQPDDVTLAPATRVDPYLRRLRRAPIE